MSVYPIIDPALQDQDQTSPHQPVPSTHTWTTPPTLSNPQISTTDILTDPNIATTRAQTWTGPARFGFNALLASQAYKNKLRLRPEKQERIIYFLTTPAAKSREKDRADAQAKHQAQQWVYSGGVLYRRDARLEVLRRHVGTGEVFDVITGEHLRAGHAGRDKMLKVLEAKYIGYTKDELMYVLDHCLVCSSKHIRGAAARRRENKQNAELDNEVDMDPTI